MDTNLTLLSGSARYLTINDTSVVNLSAGYNVTGALGKDGSGTLNLYSAVFDAGANTQSVAVRQGILNWNPVSFLSTPPAPRHSLFPARMERRR